MKLTSLKSRAITNSRGEKAVEVTISNKDLSVSASVPCGKSTGEHEAFCHTVEHSLKLIEEIKPKVLHENFKDFTNFDHFIINLDGTDNKSNLGSNVTLSLSLAFCRLEASELNKPLYKLISEYTHTIPAFPRLFFNIINGGLHVDQNLKPLPFQEYMIIPKSNSPQNATLQTLVFTAQLKERLQSEGHEIRYGDEGGFILSGSDPEEPLRIFTSVMGNLQNDLGSNFDIGLDIAASSFGSENNYKIGQKTYSTAEMLGLYKKLSEKYHILSIEDPFEQEAWNEWSNLNSEIGEKVWIVGDDLTVTNVQRIRETYEKKAANSVLIKPNQIGTITETIEAINLCRKYGWKTIISHRSGETNDSFIADIAYGSAANGLKAGSPLQGERLSKYNRLMLLEHQQLEQNVK